MVTKGNHLWPEDDCMRAVPNRGRCPASKRRIHGVLRLPIIDAVEVISGHQWSSVVISGHQRSSAVISGHQWSSVIFSGHPWSSVVISGLQWSSVVISGHQWSSVRGDAEAISGSWGTVRGAPSQSITCPS